MHEHTLTRSFDITSGQISEIGKTRQISDACINSISAGLDIARAKISVAQPLIN